MILNVVRAASLHICACLLASAQFGVITQQVPQFTRQTAAPVPSPGTTGTSATTAISGAGITGAAPSTAALQGAMGGQNPFLGAITAGKITDTVMPLTLPEAIDRGLRYNLGLFLGEQGTRQAQAAWLYARSGLLPTLNASVSDAGDQINLEALGFRGFPGVRPIVGPFNVFDARMYATQAFSLTALRNWRAGNESLAAARYSYRDARDIVVLAVAGLYLQAVSGRARIDAARAQFATAKALYDRAVNMKNAGVAAGIDVLRAQVQMQAQQQRVIYYENEFEKQKLMLERAIGIPVGQPITLTDELPYTPPPAFTLEQALATAYQNRYDYLSLSAQVRAAEASRSAAVAERYPSLAFNGNYGDIGPRPWNSHGTFTAAVALNIPVFQGGRIRADILQADAQLEDMRARLSDMRNGIDQDVRSSVLDLTAAGAQVDVAKSAVGLAAQQLRQSEDRFAAGVATGVEVVQAQEAVATADENYISALFTYNLAKASLARSLGGAERTYLQFLRGTK